MMRAPPRHGPLVGLRSAAVLLLVLVAALLAAFGWLDLLRGTGALTVGPRFADALPLRRLAGGSAQPLLRVLIAFVSAGLLAGALVRRHRRPLRAGLLLAGSLALLALASAAAYGVQETEPFLKALTTHRPGAGVLVEAALLAVAGVVAPPRVS